MNITAKLLSAGVIIVLLLLGFAWTASAGLNTWTTNGPYGGNIKGIALSPNYATDKTLFAASGTGLFKSANGGATWTAAWNSGTISVAVSPNFVSDGTVFTGTSSGVYKSVNGGTSWTLSGSIGGVYCIAISPNYASDSTVFAGTSNGGMYKTTNGGTSWTAVNTGLGTGTFIYSLAISPNYAADQTVFAGTFSTGLFKSTNGGTSWSAANSGISSNSIDAVAFSPGYSTDSTVYVGASNGVYKSTNGGVSWTVTNTGLTNTYILSLAVSPNFATDNTVYAGTYIGGVFKSTNGGASWSAASTGITSNINTGNKYIQTLAVSPSYATDNTVFAGSDINVFKTASAGGSWTAANTGLQGLPVYPIAVSPGFATDHTVYIGSSMGLLKSVDGCVSWSILGTTSFYCVVISPNYTADQTVFTDRARTSDGGAHWSAMTIGSGGNTVFAMAVSPGYATDHTVFAASSSGVFKSTNSGASWTSVSGTAVTAIAVSPNYSTDNTVFAGGVSSVYKSTNGGTSWTLMSSSIAGNRMWALVASPNYASDNTIFAGSWNTGGVSKSTNGGTSWTTVNTGITDRDVVSLAVSPGYASDQTLYAGTTYAGMFKTADGGTSWSTLNSGLGNLDVQAVAVSPNYAYDQTVFAGASALYAFSSTNATPPSSAVTAPAAGACLKGTDAAIAGTAAGNLAGSSVQGVEVGITPQGGTTTWTALSGSATNDNWAHWSYTWTPPADSSYTIMSRATDDAGNVETPGAGVTVIVDNTPPVVSAGENKAAKAQFTQTATAADANSMTYSWSKASGPGAVTFGSPAALSTTISASVDGTYIIQFTATDAAGNPASSTMTLTWDTTSPTVSAGANQTANAQFTQTATATDVNSVTYQWSKVSGPGTVTFGSPAAVSTTISASADGTYIIQFTATDAAGNPASSTMTLTWDTTPPAVSAGVNKTANAQFTQTAIATDANSMTYSWSKVSGPGTVTFGSPSALSTTISASVDGTYTIGFTATDAAGNSASSTMTLAWDATPPAVSAGANQISDTQFTQTATASDANSMTYSWSMVTGPGTVTFGTPTALSTTISADVEGAYVIQFSAMDEAGNSAYSTMTLRWTTALGPFAYIPNSGDNNVSVIDTRTNTVVATIPVGAYPFSVAVNPAGTKAYVGNWSSSNVSVIDTATNTVVATAGLGYNMYNPYGIAVNASGTLVYVACNGGVSVIDASTNTDVADVRGGVDYPYSIAMSPDGAKAYVTTWDNNNVSVIDTSTNSVVAMVPIESSPLGIAVNPAGTEVYVTNHGDSSVSVIDTSTDSVVASVAVGSGPWGIAFNPVGTRAYVANGDSNTVSVIDTSTDSVVATVDVGLSPQGISVNPYGTKVYVADTNGNDISVIDTATNSVDTTVAVGSGPIALGKFIGPWMGSTDSTPPVVSAGPNRTANAQFTQTATATDANPMTYSWSKASGPGAVTFGSPTALSTTISASVDGTYTIQFTATDAAVNSASSTMTLVWDTTPPVVSAGVNKTANAQFTQTATATDANSMTYSWSKVSGPGTVTFGSPTALSTTISASADGTYILRFTATDAAGNSSSSTMTMKWDTTPPSVSAGPDQIAGGWGPFTLTATASDANSMTYAWSKVSGPGTVTFGTPTARSTTISASTDGAYTIQFTATDAAGNSASSTMTLTWDATPPVVSAGPSRLTHSQFTQTATATDAHAIYNYYWSQLSGPGNITFGSPWSIFTTMSADVDGTYIIQFSAMDAAGNTGYATMTLTWTTALGPFAYITNSGDNNVSVIDTPANTVVATIPVGTDPFCVAVNPAGTKAYVGNYGSNSVSVIDTITNTVAATVGLPGNYGTYSPYGIAVNASGTLVYATSEYSVLVIDASTNTVVTEIQGLYYPFSIVTSADGARVYVTTLNYSDGNDVAVIDTSTNSVVAMVPIESYSLGIAVSPVVTKAYVTNRDSNSVSVIDTSTNSVVGSIAVGSIPFGVAFNPAGTRAYVVNGGSNTVSVIDTSNDSVIATVGVGLSPEGVSVTPDGTKVYVADTNGNDISVIDTATNSVDTTVAVGSGPIALGKFIGPWMGAENTAPPIVSAGTNKTANAQFTQTATVTGGVSPVAYSWSMLSGPGAVTFGTPDALSTTISASIDGTYTIQFMATDAVGNSAVSMMTLTWDTTPPTVSAGANKTANAPFTQTGTATDANAITYQWSKLSGPGTITFFTPTALSTTIAAFFDGTYVIQLTATDAAGNSSSSTMTLAWDTTSPSVSAGANKTVKAQFTQTATASDASAMTYSWSKVSGPGTVTFGTPTALSTTMSASADGTYIIRFTATDVVGNSASSTMTLIWDTTAPAVFAGQNETTGMQFTQIATASDATSMTFTWSKASGPGTITFGSPTALSTTIFASVDGTYIIAFTATDATGNSSTATMTLVWSTTGNQWTTNGPYGGSIYSLALSPNYAADRTVFAGTFDGGVYKSTDGGLSWTAVNNGIGNLYNLFVNALAVSPNYASDRTVFAGTYDGGVYKSTDGGLSWTAVNTGITTNYICALAMSPNYATDRTVYAGTYGGGVFKSTDGGLSWTAVNNGISNVNGVYISTLAVSPNYAADQTVYAGSIFGYGIYKSTDGGASWTVATAGLTSTTIEALVLSPNYASDRTVFAGTNTDGVFKSTNGGTSWYAVNTGVGLAGLGISSLAVSPHYATDQTVYVGNGLGLYRSINGGTNWTAKNSGLTNQSIHALAISPNFTADQTVYIGTNGGGVFSSTNGVACARNNGINNIGVRVIMVSPNYASDRTVYAGTSGDGVYKSTDGGWSWTHANTGITSSISIYGLAVSPNYASDSTLFTVTGDRVYKSTNGGTSWTIANTGLTSNGITVVFSPNYASDQTVYIGTWGGVFKSTDGGASWTAVGLTSLNIEALAVSPNYASDQTVFAGTYGGGVFKSTDGGASWTAVNTGLTNPYVWALAVSPNYATDQTVYAGPSNGLFKSTDSGANWTAMTGITARYIESLAVSPNYAVDQTVFAGSNGDGVYMSTDGGASWSGINSGLSNLNITSLGISPSYTTDHKVFAGSYGGGLWIYADTTPPVVSAGANKTANAQFTQAATATDLSSMTYQWSKVSGPGTITFGSPAALSTTISASVDGTYIIQFAATDSAGNSASSTMTLTWDTAPPVVSAGGNRIANAQFTQTAAATDASPMTYQWSQVSGTGVVAFGSPTALSTTISSQYQAATFTIRFTATDAAGNSAYSDMTLIWDMTAPSVNAGPNETTGRPFTQTATAMDANSMTYQWSKVSGPGTVTFGSPAALSTTISASTDGTYTLRFTATDAAGNASSSQMVLVWDATRPSGTVIINNGAAYTGSASVNLTLSATDGVCAAEYPIMCGVTQMQLSSDNAVWTEWEPASTSRAWQLSSGAGQNTVFARFMDAAGNISSVASDNIILDISAPVSYITSPSGNALISGRSCTIAGNATDGTGSGVNKVEVSINNGPWTAATGTYTWSFAWQAAGSGEYNLKSRATDNAGNIETSGAGITLYIINPLGSPELPHFNWDASVPQGACALCHVASSTFLSGSYMTDAGFCRSCHNSSGVGHGQDLYGRHGHITMANVTSGGGRLPTYGNITAGEFNNQPYSRLKGGNKIVCTTCHNVMAKPEDMGRAWEYTTTSDNITYMLQNGGWTGYNYLVPKVYRDTSLWSGPTYSKARKAYLVDPLEYTYDETAGTVMFKSAQPSTAYIYVTLDYPYLRASNGGNKLCSDCHTQTTHEGNNCLACHQAHNTDNLADIRGAVRTADRATTAVKFLRYTGVNSFADGDGTHDGICEVCHSQTKYYRRDGSQPFANHSGGFNYDRQNCTTCHRHGTGFSRGDSPSAAILGSSDSGQLKNYPVGSIIEVDLLESADAGYMWYANSLNGSMVQVVNEVTIPSGGIGGYATTKWYFQVIAPGDTTVTLLEYRPWLGSGSAINSFTLNLHIY